MRISKDGRRIILDETELGPLFRYELPLKELLGEKAGGGYSFYVEGSYRATLNDLRAALGNILYKDPTIEDLGKYWYYPVCLLSAELLMDEDTDPPPRDQFRFTSGILPLNDRQVFLDTWDAIETFCSENEGKEKVSSAPNIRICRDYIDSYLVNKNVPLRDRTFTDIDKWRFLNSIDISSVAELEGDELFLCRRFSEELSSQNDTTALLIKGLSCYFGNVLYPKDMAAAEENLSSLYRISGDPFAAGLLGNICIEGLNNGRPDFDSAFRYYSAAAASDDIHSMMMLSTMYSDGLGCTKSVRAAHDVVFRAYTLARRDFSPDAGHDDFAGCAFMLARLCSDPDNIPYGFYDRDDSVRFLLEARSAAEMYGPAKHELLTRINETLKTRFDIVPGDSSDCRHVEDCLKPVTIFELVTGWNRSEIIFEPEPDGICTVKARRLPCGSSRKAAPEFVCVTESGFCEFTDRTGVRAYGFSWSFGEPRTAAVCVDFCKWNYSDQRTDLFADGRCIGWFASDRYALLSKKDL